MRGEMSRQATFDMARAAFVPAPDDNPDCVPFYRTHTGLVAAWGADFRRAYDNAVHRAASAASYANGNAYSVAVQTLQMMAAAYVPPRPPQSLGLYAFEPDPTAPIYDARQFFNREYKRAFPGQRANSKHANAQWAEKRRLAEKLMTEVYAADMAAYRAKQERIETEERKRRQEWMDGIHAAALFENAVIDLLAEMSE